MGRAASYIVSPLSAIKRCGRVRGESREKTTETVLECPQGTSRQGGLDTRSTPASEHPREQRTLTCSARLRPPRTRRTASPPRNIPPPPGGDDTRYSCKKTGTAAEKGGRAVQPGRERPTRIFNRHPRSGAGPAHTALGTVRGNNTYPTIPPVPGTFRRRRGGGAQPIPPQEEIRHSNSRPDVDSGAARRRRTQAPRSSTSTNRTPPSCRRAAPQIGPHQEATAEADRGDMTCPSPSPRGRGRCGGPRPAQPG